MFFKLKEKLKIFTAKIYFKLHCNGIFYITTTEVLPPPLDKEEEKTCMEELKDPRKKEIAKTTLIERNLRLVVYIAKKFENTATATEDLVSIGTIGLIKAVNTFNPDKQIKLATYASKCIENEILMHLRKVSKLKGEISLDEPLNCDWDGNELLLSDILSTEQDSVVSEIERNADFDILFDAITNLSDYEKNLISLRYGLYGQKRKTQKEVADVMNISQSYISRLEKKVVKRLRTDILKMQNH